MGKITKKQATKFKSLDQFLDENLSKKEIQELEQEAKSYVSVLKEMQEAISSEVAKYMAQEGIGFNELTRRLETSTRQTSKIVKGEANLTLETLADLSKVMGKVPRIVWESPKKSTAA